MSRSRPADGLITVRTSSHGITLSLAVPSYAGWIVTRPTLSEALAALAENIAPRDVERVYGPTQGDA